MPQREFATTKWRQQVAAARKAAVCRCFSCPSHRITIAIPRSFAREGPGVRRQCRLTAIVPPDLAGTLACLVKARSNLPGVLTKKRGRSSIATGMLRAEQAETTERSEEQCRSIHSF